MTSGSGMLGFKSQNGSVQLQFEPGTPSASQPSVQINFLSDSITVYRNEGTGWQPNITYRPS